jgi:hypothetical protein
MARRHPNIDNDNVWLLAIDQCQQAGDVNGLADDIEAGRAKGSREGLAQQDGIVGEDDPDLLAGRAQGEGIGPAGDAPGGGR